MSTPDVEALPRNPSGPDPGPPGQEAEKHATLRALARRFPGWTLWYGAATRCWWALPPAHCRERVGLIEAGTADELAMRLRWIEECRAHLDADRPDAPAVRQRCPYPGNPHPAMPGGGSAANERRDEDDDASAVHAARRVH
ncbi:hypothetical protein [Streptosporangium sp. NBC_01756]|uniref:hypothetical protein n=1 Tax=Streptosporangium sp. NBC_01756 TaxID=2975950 RepID=UPI002DDBD9D2|nr:hypothetical protein [Streptosporangium sp. NBC_01756]WSC89653.1 hypothetical protein OIE48_16160 [Streptosporangium sp. NBC_01756]